MDTLWPDLPVEARGQPPQGGALCAPGARLGGVHWHADAGMVTLIPDGGVNSDVERFETAAGEALGSGDERSCTTAAGWPAGVELLPEDRYAPGRRSRGAGCACVTSRS